MLYIYGTHPLRCEEEKATYTCITTTTIHMHHNVVGMHYSLAVIFNVFPVFRKSDNTAVMSKNH